MVFQIGMPKAFHFLMGILFYKKYPQIVEEKYIG
jgi:hypothetical protein